MWTVMMGVLGVGPGKPTTDSAGKSASSVLVGLAGGNSSLDVAPIPDPPLLDEPLPD